MKNKTYYFPHDFHARNDIKITNLIMAHGMEGVGIFWCLVEMLYEEGGSIPYECERIAFAMRTQCDKIESVLRDFSLFKIEQNFITSDTVKTRLNVIQAKSKAAQKSALARWDANAMRPLCERNANKEKKIKENKRKEIKENIQKKNSKSDFVLPFWIPSDTWESYVSLRDRKRAPQTSYAYRLIIKKLESIQTETGDDPIEVLDQSIESGWTSVYPLKKNGNASSSKNDLEKEWGMKKCKSSHI